MRGMDIMFPQTYMTKTMGTRDKGVPELTTLSENCIEKYRKSSYFYSNDSDNDDVVFQVLGLPCTIVLKSTLYSTCLSSAVRRGVRGSFRGTEPNV